MQCTGAVQLLGGICGEAWMLWESKVGKGRGIERAGENWRNWTAMVILGMYVVLWLRDLRIKERQREKVTTVATKTGNSSRHASSSASLEHLARWRKTNMAKTHKREKT